MLYYIIERGLLVIELATGISFTPALRLLLQVEQATCEVVGYCSSHPWG